MNRLRLLLLLIATFSVTTKKLYAQKSAIQTAYNYLRYDDLDKAKEAIDQAATNESTVSMSKTWFYRGQIYHAIFESTKDQFKSMKRGSLDEAYKSYVKTLELDTKGEYKDDLLKRITILSSQFLNEGVDNFKDKKYNDALSDFEKSLAISSKFLNYSDTLAMYNAALSADKSNNNEKARKYYKDLIALNYGGPKMFSFLASKDLAANDTTAALITLKSGRLKYPSNAELAVAELNIYLSSGKDKEATAQVDQAIVNDPTNSNLYYAKGVLNDKLGNSAIAEAAYKKAIELKPDFFDANYNLGASLFNQGAEMVIKANAFPASKQKEFEAMKKLYDAKFLEAKPYFEKAYQLNPKDLATLQNLKQIYTRLNDLSNAAEMKKAIESLK